MLDHKFNGPPFSVGIEEELMLLDADSLDLAQAVEEVLADVPTELEGQVKPEFMQSFLEVATTPCPDVGSAVAELHRLRQAVAEIAERQGLRIGAAGTHPFARWEDQLIVDRPRYHYLAETLGFIARQFLIFGTHIHVGIDGPDRAIYVADGVRRYLPVLLCMSSNSPFLRGLETGMMSSRTPTFRSLPRAGVPPHYGTWEVYSNRVELMMEAGAIEDYTYLWFDVRPHPNLGTVETRIFDQQTRVEHTAALAALTTSLAHHFAALYDQGVPLVEAPSELVDDNKVRAALRGLEGELVDFTHRKVVPAADMCRHLFEVVGPDAAALGCESELAGVEALLEQGTGAQRQLRLFERRRDLKSLMTEIADVSCT